jgi:hypothetical protein
MLKEGDVTLDPAKTHLSKKDKKKLTKKQYRARDQSTHTHTHHTHTHTHTHTGIGPGV